jgi:hypothetical protein
MTRIFLLTIFLVGLFSCSSKQTSKQDLSNQDSVTSKDTVIVDPIIESKIHVPVDRAFIGMTISELRKEYKSSELRKEPVFMYGVDGEGDGILVVQDKEELFFAWTMYDNDSITGLVILSPSILIDKGIHVGMTYQDFLKHYPKETLAISEMDEDFEFSYIDSLNYTIEFHTSDSNRVGKYTQTESWYEYKGIQRPLSKIDRIHVR